MKAKDYLIFILLITMSIIMGLSSATIKEIYQYNKDLQEMDFSIESLHIYVNFAGTEEKDNSFVSTYDNQIHYGYNQETLDTMERMGCKVYPYIGLFIHEAPCIRFPLYGGSSERF